MKKKVKDFTVEELIGYLGLTNQEIEQEIEIPDLKDCKYFAAILNALAEYGKQDWRMGYSRFYERLYGYKQALIDVGYKVEYNSETHKYIVEQAAYKNQGGRE